MNEPKPIVSEHVTEDGYCFLATTIGMYGRWVVNVDLQKAIEGANSGRQNLVQVFYCKHADIRISDFGHVTFVNDSRPIPIGLFFANVNTFKFSKPGDQYRDFFDALECEENDGLHHSAWVDKHLKKFGQVS